MAFRRAIDRRTASGKTTFVVELREELNPCWDARVFLDVAEDTALLRGVMRDAHDLGGRDEAEALYRRRYLPAFEIYSAQCDAAALADIVMENNQPDEPILHWRETQAHAGKPE